MRIKTREDLNKFLFEDAKANGIFSNLQFRIRLFFRSENACVVSYLRALRHQEYHLNNCGLYHKIAYFWYKFLTARRSHKYGIGINVNTVGYGLRMPHNKGGIVINCLSMGNYCEVNGGVVIGRKRDNSEVATIGNNVVFSVGAKIIGKIRIGDNVVVAPNAVVVKDVESNTVVGGIPAKSLK